MASLKHEGLVYRHSYHRKGRAAYHNDAVPALECFDGGKVEN